MPKRPLALQQAGNAVVPLYLDAPEKWARLMRTTLAFNGSYFNTNRMVKQYTRNAYYPGGCLITIRDYENEKRGKNILKPYGVRVEGDNRYVIFQIWDFDGDFYDLTVYFVEENLQSKQVTTETMHSRYYAISTAKMMRLMEQVGFEQVKRVESPNLPVLLGTVPA
jgi:hypothetical protein